MTTPRPRLGDVLAPGSEWPWAPGVAVVAGGVAILCLALLTDVSGARLGVLAGIALVAAVGAPTALRLRRDALDAPGLAALATIVLIGFTSISWLGSPTRPYPGLEREDVVTALVLVALGLASLGIGAWLLGPARAPAPLVLRSEDTPSWPALVALAAVSVLAVGTGIALESYGYISDPEATRDLLAFAQVFALLGTLGHLIVLATALVCFQRGGRRLGILLTVLVTFQVAIGFFIGSKTPTILPIVLVLLAYVVSRRRLPVTALVITLILLFVAVVPMNTRYREAVRVEGLQPRQALSAALAEPLELNPAAAAQDVQQYILGRFSAIDSIAAIYDQTPSRFPYARGESYYLLPVILLIPRAIWQDKPQLTDTAEFTQTYRGAPEEVRSATQLSQVGDLYRNFSWPGVPGGMLVWGMALAAASALCRRNPSPRVASVYIFAVPTIFLKVEATLPDLIASGARELPFAALVAWLVLPGRTSQPGYRRLLGRASSPTAPASR